MFNDKEERKRGIREEEKEGRKNDRRTLGQFSVLNICGNHGHSHE